MIAPALPETQGVCSDGQHYAKATFSSSSVVIRCALSLKIHLYGVCLYARLCVTVPMTSTGAQVTEYISCGA